MAQEINQKIILFLSTMNAKAQARAKKDADAGDDYVCPDKTTVRGLQTNEAPVKYLLNTHKNVSEILCLVTDEARETAWDRFQATVRATGSKAKCVDIKFEANTPIQEILPDILNRTHKGDEILLEITGGFRDTIMYLVLISRALSYKGVKTTCAVYSSYQTYEVKDVSELLPIFDLIDGMQNLTSFGNVAALRRYYKDRDHSGKIDDLLNAVDELWGCITLCRSSQVPDKLKAFNKALKGAEECGDPLLEALLPAFRDKFGDEMTLPDLIRWCAESDMLQQALTLYRERIPAYIMNERTDILAVKPNVQPLNMNNYSKYETEGEARFCTQFLNIGHSWYAGVYGNDAYKAAKEQEGDYLITLKHFEKALKQSDFKPLCTVEQLRTITMDFLYIRALRNMVNHASDDTKKDQRALNKYLEKEGHYILPEKTTATDVKNAILNGLNNLKLQPQKA